jgi:hypothetical protein
MCRDGAHELWRVYWQPYNSKPDRPIIATPDEKNATAAFARISGPLYQDSD